MSYISNIGGKLTITAKGSIKIYAKENIEITSAKSVCFTGVENGVSFGKPEEPPKKEEIIFPADCVVHFRPMKNWKGKNYGFDWMRIDDTGVFGDDNYKELVGNYDKYPSSEANEEGDPTAIFTERINIYNELKKEYSPNPALIPWLTEDKKPLEYFPSWLCVEKDKEITLSLRVLIKDKKDLPKSLVIAYEQDYFEITSTLGKGTGDKTILPEDSRLNYAKIPIKKDRDYFLTDEIKIKCIKDILATHKTIKVLQDGKEAGYLQVLPTQKKILNVVCVKVNYLTSINKPRKVKGKTQLEEYLNHALIKTNIVEVDLNISKNADGTQNEILNQETIRHDSNINISGTVLSEGKKMKLSDYLNIVLTKKFQDSTGKGIYDNFLKIYYFDEIAYIKIPRTEQFLKIGGMGSLNSGHAIVFKEINDVDIAHEAMHALGLNHPFGTADQYNNNPYDFKYMFKYKSTENIMDYAHLANHEKYSTWKWQWEILRAHDYVINEI